MADGTSSAAGLAGLALTASLMEALLKQGVIDRTAVDAIIRDSASYVDALCTDCGPEIERDARRLLTLIAKAEPTVATKDGSPIPLVDPAGS
jgi:hypothetical protein